MKQYDCDIEYDASFTIDFASFKKIAKDAAVLCDDIEISIQAQMVKFMMNGFHGGGTIDIRDCDRTNLSEEREISGKYITKYLVMSTQTKNVDEMVHISIMERGPLKITYKICDGARLEFVVAPKMHDDSD